jgi:hypothetical protein
MKRRGAVVIGRNEAKKLPWCLFVGVRIRGAGVRT